MEGRGGDTVPTIMGREDGRRLYEIPFLKNGGTRRGRRRRGHQEKANLSLT
jgi:hypothetical protein